MPSCFGCISLRGICRRASFLCFVTLTLCFLRRTVLDCCCSCFGLTPPTREAGGGSAETKRPGGRKGEALSIYCESPGTPSKYVWECGSGRFQPWVFAFHLCISSNEGHSRRFVSFSWKANPCMRQLEVGLCLPDVMLVLPLRLLSSGCARALRHTTPRERLAFPTYPGWWDTDLRSFTFFETPCSRSTYLFACFADVEAETSKMQKQCDATEVRMQVARKAFDKARKPLEAAVRLQREELAKRKVRGKRWPKRYVFTRIDRCMRCCLRFFYSAVSYASAAGLAG